MNEKTTPKHILAARGLGLTLAFIVIAFMLMARLKMHNQRSADTLAAAELAMCETFSVTRDTAEEERALERFRETARDALRGALSDPYAAFLFQVANSWTGGETTSPLPEGEGPVLRSLYVGDVETARAAVTQLALDGTMLDGRLQLWSRVLGSLEVSLSRDCAPTD